MKDKIIAYLCKRYSLVRAEDAAKIRITRTLSCAWCGKEFEWSGTAAENHALYCSTRHKKNAQDARRHRRNSEESKKTPPKRPTRAPEASEMSQIGRCPNPFKLSFRTKEEAQIVINKVDPKMHAYKCVCGAMHIGHPSKGRKKASHAG